MDEINLPKHVKYIIEKLNEAGYEAYIVGGCVRDSIMKIAPKDWDITTSAYPEEVKDIFSKTIDTGIKHGTVTIMLDKQGYEVTTYRVDGLYEDFRRPKEVTFTQNIIEDLKRRDFNMNAIAYHPKEGYVDPFNGMEDIKNKVISCVGVADERFNEDALRMLRAVRFSAKLGFNIDEETYESIKTNAKLIENISAERIREELSKTILSDNPMKFNDLYETGVLDYIMPEFSKILETEQCHPYHCYNVGIHTLRAVENIEKKYYLRWAMLFHDLGKAEVKTTENGVDHFYGHEKHSEKLANDIMNRLKFDNKNKNLIKRLIKYHEYRPELEKKHVRKMISKVGKDIFLDLIEVQRADGMAKSIQMKEDVMLRELEVKQIYEKILEDKECIDKKEMAITGNDLIKGGFNQGKELGETLDKLFKMIIEDPTINEKEKLLQIAKEMRK